MPALPRWQHCSASTSPVSTANCSPANWLSPSECPATGRIGDLLACCQALPSELADRNLSADLALAKDLVPALADLAGVDA